MSEKQILMIIAAILAEIAATAAKTESATALKEAKNDYKTLVEQEKKVAQERAKAEEKALDTKLEQTIAGVYNSLPSEKRQALEASI